MPQRSKWIERVSLLGILVLAVALRFWGLRWGLPNAAHTYSYHPDEFLILGAAGSALVTGLPALYNYPSLYIYLVALALGFTTAFGLPAEFTDLYLSARVVAAIMGVVAVWVIFWAAKRFWGKWEAILASAILCVAPLHVQHSHFATVDVPSTLFIAACLGFCALIYNTGSWRAYLLGGVMAGLAAGTKYNAGLVVLALIAAHFFAAAEHKAGFRRLLAGFGCAAAAFVVTTPGIFLKSRDFIFGFTYELNHAAQGHGLVFAGTGNGFLYTLKSSLWYGLGPGLAVLFIASICYAVYARDKKALIILAFSLPYYALISISQVRFARYTLPLFPAAALLVGWMMRDVWIKLPRVGRVCWAGLGVVIVSCTLLYTVALDKLFATPDPRDRAELWISQNIPIGSRINIIEVPWFYSPPYSKNTGFGTLQQREREMRQAPYHLQLTPVYHNRRAATWWVVSDYEADDALRLARQARSHPVSTPPKEWVNTVDTMSDLNRYYTRHTFSSPLNVCGVSFDTRSLPHDMRYAAPTIWIYKLKK